MKAYKERQFLVFDFEDGKSVKYDLSTGQTFGKSGRPVKSIQTQLRGYNVRDVIDSFGDENYKAFLSFINKNFINKPCGSPSYYHTEINKIRNTGTFLSRISKYSFFEQWFAAGFRDISPNFTKAICDVPKGYINICRNYNLEVNNESLDRYYLKPDFWNMVFNLDYITLSPQDIKDHLWVKSSYSFRRDGFRVLTQLVSTYRYTYKPLMLYLDYLSTYEALDNITDILGEIKDYASMMSAISGKFDKYPRNFLTTHKIAIRNYTRLKEKFDEELFASKRRPELEYKYKKYVITYPETTQDIKDEAVMQNNCVASYIKNVLADKCHILFLRFKDYPDKSLVTLELRGRKVVQCKQKFNMPTTAEQNEVIAHYEKMLERKQL